MRSRGGTHFRYDTMPTLTDRQQAVMRLLERGQTNGQIAEALGITLDGAKFHVAEIIGRLGVTTREEAVEAWKARPGRVMRLAAMPILRWTAGLAGSAAVVAAAGLVWASLASGDGESGADPTVASPTAPAESPSQSGAALAPCAPSPPILGAPGSGDWIDFVRFDGVSYWGGGWGGPILTAAAESLGPEYGRVSFTLSTAGVSSNYQIGDCHASYLPAGTALYTIAGYDPRFRIALANGKVYESYTAKGIQTAGEITDLRGKVTSIEFRTTDAPAVTRGEIDDPATIIRLVDDFLGARFDAARTPTEAESQLPTVRLVFVLADGTEFSRAYRPAAGWVWPGIWVPASFNDAANAAMSSP